MLRWILSQSLLVQYAVLLPPLVIGGVAASVWLGRRGRLRRRAERAARRAADAARRAGVPIRACGVWGSIDVSPDALAVVYYVEDDATLATVESSGAANRLRDLTMEFLRDAGYPGLPHAISVVSDESVRRAGGWREYFS